MRHKLLLADDSVTIQKVIELTFADEDIEVIAVSDGQQAITRAPIDRPDIVLADVGMPERDGYEVAAFIKETPELSHIPVLLLTGAFEPIDEGRARAVHCDGVLVKPFEPQMVINRVKELIAGRRSDASGAAGASSPAPFAAAVAAAPPRTGGTTDEYFDRLDAAFSVRETPAPASFSPAPPAPDLVPPPAATPAPERTVVSAAAGMSATMNPAASTARPADAPAGTEAPTLAQAFAALLAAEQGKVPAPPPPSEQALRDDVIEEVTRRVVERLTDRVARDVVADVAERVVREEIDRIKARARAPRAAAGPDTMS